MSQEFFVYAETRCGTLRPVALELVGKTRQLADGCGGRVTALLVGPGLAEQTAPLITAGADRVLLVEGAGLDTARDLAHAREVAALCRTYAPDVLLLGATSFGRALAPHVAALLKTGLTADCTVLEMGEEGLLWQTRPAFGGNLLATITCPDSRPQMATVRPKVFPVPPMDASRRGEVLRVPAVGGACAVTLLADLPQTEDGAIGEADVLVAVGSGIGSDENLRMAEELARRLGGALAASRPLVDAGRVSYPHQVGQTGKTVTPKVYLALGISGAIQHLAGVSAEKLIAVNIDPDAPIFAASDVCVVADCGDFLRELLALTAQR